MRQSLWGLWKVPEWTSLSCSLMETGQTPRSISRGQNLGHVCKEAMYFAFWDLKAEGPIVKARWGHFPHSLPKEGWGWALVKGAVASLLRPQKCHSVLPGMGPMQAEATWHMSTWCSPRFPAPQLQALQSLSPVSLILSRFLCKNSWN